MLETIHYLIVYIGIINIIAFLAMVVDKKNAVQHHWRISERTLLFLGIFGGTFGILSGMTIVKHKLSKTRFRVGMPVVGVIYYIFLVYIAFKF